MVLRTPAKVNLALEVLRKRPDGYHELSTVLQAVDLCDRLTVETADTITLETSEPGLPTDERNLVVRAARMLRDAAGVDRGARIRLEKRIPLAAGLGGGSSDAAATLWGLNRLWGLRWKRERLVELAVALGMDVPFFLGRGRALGTGRGEVLRPLPSVAPSKVVSSWFCSQASAVATVRPECHVVTLACPCFSNCRWIRHMRITIAWI